MTPSEKLVSASWQEAFFERVAVGATPTQCWIWKGNIQPNGYGRLNHKGKSFSAHRLSYQIHKGEIPERLVIDHICRTPACVNPDHLRACDNRLNVLIGIGPSAVNSRKTTCKYGHPLTDDNVGVSLTRGGRRCKICNRATSKASKANPNPGRPLCPPEKMCRGEDHSSAVLDAEKVAYIRSSTAPSRALGKRFGVSNTAILLVRRRQTWKHVP